MIDIRFVRDNPDAVKASQRARGADESLVDQLLTADESRRSTLQLAEDTRAEQKALSRTVGKATPEERPAILEQAQALSAKVKELEQVASEANDEYERVALSIPNVIVDGVPSGGEDDYTVLKHIGEVPEFSFPVRDHLDIGEGLDAIDMARGTKVSGSRFYYLTGIGARLELALLTAAADLAEANGFKLTMTPTLVKPEVMGGTGFLGAHADEIYHLPTDDLYLVGTSEVALAGFHSGEIIDLSDGPKRYAGWSSCYRREAGSYGKDTRGIIRVHQFNKVEMFSYCPVEDAEEEHQRLLGWEEEMLAKVELPYRVIDTAAGDLGSSAARKFDCEAWLPSQERWMEVTSTSNCTTFQARRLGIRERYEGKTRTVATLNGTLATTRWLVAILENHQQEDGSLYVPEGLRPYLGGRDIIKPA
ncbi:MAG: serine--tRNA ligase [Flaviflexus sp.]|uniref:serine--tRNA ligase n=1 Tax=Flaviflexus sp. TaxID=1969482 RepID=UPI003F935EE4